MKQIQQRIKIAEACGWRSVAFHPIARSLLYGWPKSNKGCLSSERELVPDYLNDLNAMHEAEKNLDVAQSEEYIAFLYYGDQHEHAWDQTAAFEVATSTAAQRAEALLRALNLWEESSEPDKKD
jgi:hypothetical protein